MRVTQFLGACTALASDNLHEDRGRSAYLVVTLAITVAAWLILAALAAPFISKTSIGSGVTITNGSQQSAPLPLHYARRIQAIPDARDVAWFTLQMASCGTNTQVTLNAWGGPGTAAQVSSIDHPVAPATLQAWAADPLGILISRQTANDCGWRIGQGVSPAEPFGDKQIPMHIVGIFEGRGDVVYAHYDYINRIGSLFGKDTVLKYLASSGNARDDELLAARIEATFAHDFPTVNAATNTTLQNAWARFGKVQQLLAFVMAAILLCAASVLASVLAHAAAQRRAKFALLKVLGFQRGILFCAFALEVVVVVAIGVLSGVGVGELVAHLTPISLTISLGGLEIPHWAYWWMPLWVAMLVATALAWPLATISRVQPVDCRTV